MQGLHANPREAIDVQKRLASAVSLRPLRAAPRTIAGADVSSERFGEELYAGVVVLSYPELELVSYAVAKADAEFPYVPGLLSFREVPGLLSCLERLPEKPDLIIVDGQGIAHPRRFGIASHLGVITGIPTIGCAKSRLYGEFDPPQGLGEAARIIDPRTREALGFALMSKIRSNPLIVSPGHMIGLEEALGIVRSCLRGYRLPEPTRQAHILVNRFRRGETR